MQQERKGDSNRHKRETNKNPQILGRMQFIQFELTKKLLKMSQAWQIHIRHLRQLLDIPTLLYPFHILERMCAGAHQHGLEATIMGKDHIRA